MRRGELKQVWQWKDEPEEKRSENGDLKVLEPTTQNEAQDAPDQDGETAAPGSGDGSQPVAEDEEEAEEEADDKPKKKRHTKKRRG